MTDSDSSIKVLLIDDQPTIGEAIRRMLASETDIIFYYCRDPTQAIKQAREVRPTVILQDLVMPDIEGLMLVRFLRAKDAPTHETPLIVLSSKEEPLIKAEAFKLGANDYLVKLPDKMELIARIRYHSAAYINLLKRKKAEERLKEENLRLSAEIEITRRLQQMILPKQTELEQIEGLEIAGFMEPASDVGGDYYDVLHYNGRVKIGIGDVTGHGLESGVVMIMVQTAIRTLMTHNETDMVKFWAALNRTIYDNVERINSDKNLTLALLDYENNCLRLSGQHESVIVVRQAGEVEIVDTIDLGFPVGLEADITDFLGETEIHLNSGDVVVLYTDGITEAENVTGELYGLDRLCQVISQNWEQSAENIKTAAIADVRQHISNHTVFDDITLLVIKQK
ncbi:PP2C family protein-serine/threonine phosphatase [Aphanothece sacrum]|uniref:Two-component response regulator n=1 Tax=Aphanothece sacrum FPU1 TaxID=1920663 RepID=A0A401IKU8_APHSA|nr:SpoIIE family protein phosphatase [Aphanothece sacrum]GBF81880.1 two-component response regulator [Aphanothece sacrum FPU1]GBF83509.1 two-component response regulator [Aphanothece sacrum FPU3]